MQFKGFGFLIWSVFLVQNYVNNYICKLSNTLKIDHTPAHLRSHLWISLHIHGFILATSQINLGNITV